MLHIRTVLSSEADARYSESLDQAISDMPCVCPTSVLMKSPVSVSQIFMSLSAASLRIQHRYTRHLKATAENTPEEASILPSGLNLTAEMERVCPLNMNRVLKFGRLD